MARDILLKGNCFICEADLFVSDYSVFEAEFEKSCYYGKMIPGHSDDWVFDLDDNGRITRVGKSGVDQYNMTGISYFLEKDAKILYDCIVHEYGREGYEMLFWDDVLIDIFSSLSCMFMKWQLTKLLKLIQWKSWKL